MHTAAGTACRFLYAFLYSAAHESMNGNVFNQKMKGGPADFAWGEIEIFAILGYTFTA